MISKQQYQKLLEELHKFENPDIKKEQYYTEPNIAGQLINMAFMSGDIENKTIIDLGCGTGFLGIGALINDAKKVYFLDIDKSALNIAKKNINYLNENYDFEYELNEDKFELIESDILEFDVLEFFNKIKLKKIDTVIMNPPFGLRNKDIDIKFLEKAILLSDKIYMIQKKIRINEKISRFAKNYDLKLDIIPLDYKMKKQYSLHKNKFKDMDFCIAVLTR